MRSAESLLYERLSPAAEIQYDQGCADFKFRPPRSIPCSRARLGYIHSLDAKMDGREDAASS